MKWTKPKQNKLNMSLKPKQCITDQNSKTQTKGISKYGS